MWFTPYCSSTSSVRSASSWVTELSAAAPKMARVLMWPVRPNGCVAIIPLLPHNVQSVRCADAPSLKYARSMPGQGRGVPPGPRPATADHRSGQDVMLPDGYPGMHAGAGAGGRDPGMYPGPAPVVAPRIYPVAGAGGGNPGISPGGGAPVVETPGFLPGS